MITDRKIAIFIVAYNAATTLIQTLERIPDEIVNMVSEIFIFDDHSTDDTYNIGEQYRTAKGINKLSIFKNPKNLGYGGNQKVGYDYAINKGYDYVVLLHGDGQYAPEALPQLLQPIIQGEAEVVFGSRMMSRGNARKGGMPLYKYLGNIILSRYENFTLKMNLSEFHSGYRIYSCTILSKIPYHLNTDDFHFDTEIIIQLKELGIKIKELPIPTYYGDEICYVNGLVYAKNVFKTVFDYVLYKKNLKYVKKYDLSPTQYQEKMGEYSSHTQIKALVPNRQRVLDVGCGEGFISQSLVLRGCEVIGADFFQPKDISFFSEFFSVDLENGLNLSRKKYDAYFDYIIFADVIEHITKPEKLLVDTKKYLAKGGKIIISTGNIANWYIRISLLFGRFNYALRGLLDKTHVHLYTKKTLLDLMRNNNLKVIKKQYTIIPYVLAFPSLKNSPFLKIINFFSYGLAKLWPTLFAYQFILEAKLSDPIDEAKKVYLK